MLACHSNSRQISKLMLASLTFFTSLWQSQSVKPSLDPCLALDNVKAAGMMNTATQKKIQCQDGAEYRTPPCQ